MAKPAARFTRLPAADRRSALIDAALACMAEGGIAAFTVDRVSAKAQVSRGLITHHFGGMAGLLAATYGQLYAQAVPTADSLPPGAARLNALLDALFAPEFFNRPALNMWLTMWGAIANTPELTEEHRRQYAGYVAMVAALIAERSATPNPEALARTFICLVDGLSLQHCIDPPSMPAETARQACLDFLTPHLRPA